jgi:hypothetical protein
MDQELKKGTPTFKSIFSMGQLDMERYSKLLSAADLYGTRVWDGDIDAIKPFYSLLKQFYIQVRFLIKNQEKFETLKRGIESMIRNVESNRKRGNEYHYMIPRLLRTLEEFSLLVYEYKQIIGLGIEVEQKLSKKQMWERAARIGE